MMPDDSNSLPSALAVGALLTQAARDIRTRLDQAFAAIGLTAQQASLILHVSQGHGNPRILAELVGTDAASLTRLADRLIAKGHIVRRPSGTDRRSVEISLTAKGAALLPQIPPIFGKVSTRIVAGLEPVEIDMLDHALRQVRTNLAD